MGDRILGKDYDVTPVEAFVFGCSILIHDAAMAVAAYEGGLEELKGTNQWQTVVSAALRQRGLDVNSDTIANPPDDVRNLALFHVLRVAHAAQAEELMSRQWDTPKKAGAIHLLDDSELRDFYGQRIGRIAHSHHWDIDKVEKEFSPIVGAMPGLPAEWTLNEVKVACMLRCADAAHIDERRAPRMLYAIKNPQGISEQHWRFQSKLNQPSDDGQRVVYSSGSDFGPDDAAAWWLCLEVARMIDGELKAAGALLVEKGAEAFALSGVKSVESAALFAKEVKVRSWIPVDAEVRVSDPVRLASTLGGKNLYGPGYHAPVRELVQNAVDAVRARRSALGCEDYEGHIWITVERKNGEIWFGIEDDGIGMPQRILVGTLLDFGKSLWNSPSIIDEYPKLQTQGMRTVGKFGIGFFSIFLLGSDVEVLSRKYDAGQDGVMALSFSSLVKRPILRQAPDEIRQSISTAVRVKLEDAGPALNADAREGGSELDNYILRMIAGLDIKVSIRDEVNNFQYVHNPEWDTIDADTFLSELLAGTQEDQLKRVQAAYSPLLSVLKDSAGNSIGRAALALPKMASDVPGYIAVGGITYGVGSRRQSPTEYFFEANGDYLVRADRELGFGLPFVGIIAGETDDAARRGASPSIPDYAKRPWLSAQAKSIDPKRFDRVDLIELCHRVVLAGGDPHEMPFCFAGGRLITYDQFCELVKSSSKLHLVLEQGYQHDPRWKKIQSIPSRYFVNRVDHNILCLSLEDDKVLPEDEGRDMLKSLPVKIERKAIARSGRGGMSILFDQIEKTWGHPPSIVIEYVQPLEGDFAVSPTRVPMMTLGKRNV